jgi:hypothetical protein
MKQHLINIVRMWWFNCPDDFVQEKDLGIYSFGGWRQVPDVLKEVLPLEESWEWDDDRGYLYTYELKFQNI